MPHITLANIATTPPKAIQKAITKEKTKRLLEELDDLQNLLYAEQKHAILIIIQGMDASGKDGVTRHVFGKLNPQGVLVQSFKTPTATELSHDFLWRIHQHAPAKGMIQIFNRSHYEDVLITRVHKWCNDHMAEQRMDAINNFEALLQKHNNTHILKFYLHISQDEQEKRLKERIHNPEKQWKYNEKDVDESKLWKEYMHMYEACFNHCNKVPWHIIPADANWYKEFLIASTLHKLLKSLHMQFPGIKQ